MPAGGHYLIKLLSCLQLFAHAKGLRQCQDLGAWRNLALFFFLKRLQSWCVISLNYGEQW